MVCVQCAHVYKVNTYPLGVQVWMLFNSYSLVVLKSTIVTDLLMNNAPITYKNLVRHRNVVKPLFQATQQSSEPGVFSNHSLVEEVASLVCSNNIAENFFLIAFITDSRISCTLESIAS